MPIFTVQHLYAEGHWCFLASFIDRLDLIEFIKVNRHRTRIMCGTRLILNLHAHVPEAMTTYDLAALVYNMTAPLVPVSA